MAGDDEDPDAWDARVAEVAAWYDAVVDFLGAVRDALPQLAVGGAGLLEPVTVTRERRRLFRLFRDRPATRAGAGWRLGVFSPPGDAAAARAVLLLRDGDLYVGETASPGRVVTDEAYMRLLIGHPGLIADLRHSVSTLFDRSGLLTSPRPPGTAPPDATDPRYWSAALPRRPR